MRHGTRGSCGRNTGNTGTMVGKAVAACSSYLPQVRFIEDGSGRNTEAIGNRQYATGDRQQAIGDRR